MSLRHWELLLLPSAPLDGSQRRNLDLSLRSHSQSWFSASSPRGRNPPLTLAKQWSERHRWVSALCSEQIQGTFVAPLEVNRPRSTFWDDSDWVIDMFEGKRKASFSNYSCLKILTTPLQPHSSSCLHSPHICSAVPPQMISLIFVFRDGSIQKFVNTVDNVLLLPSSVLSRFSACGWDIFKVKVLKIVARSSPPGLLFS